MIAGIHHALAQRYADWAGASEEQAVSAPGAGGSPMNPDGSLTPREVEIEAMSLTLISKSGDDAHRIPAIAH
jgi:hypothetical protein